MTFLLDASLTLSWFFEDERNEFAEAVKQSLRQTDANVPALWLAEVANALIVAERRGRISASTLKRAPEVLQRLPIQISHGDPLMRDLTTIARKHALSAYDAWYVWVAREKRLPIATLDARLERACHNEGVRTFQP